MFQISTGWDKHNDNSKATKSDLICLGIIVVSASFMVFSQHLLSSNSQSLRQASWFDSQTSPLTVRMDSNEVGPLTW